MGAMGDHVEGIGKTCVDTSSPLHLIHPRASLKVHAGRWIRTIQEMVEGDNIILLLHNQLQVILLQLEAVHLLAVETGVDPVVVRVEAAVVAVVAVQEAPGNGTYDHNSGVRDK